MEQTRTTPDETMASIVTAVELGRSGQRVQAREALTALWEQISATGDALHRCTLAHHLADLQDTTQAELEWDERALVAADDLTDERAQRYESAWQVRLLLPSLHLNLADDHRRLGDPARAREHLAQARSLVPHLPDDQYGGMIRSSFQHVSEALATGSTQRLDSPPSGG